MKYSELHKRLRKAGCQPTGREIAGHPEWYSPLTGKYFSDKSSRKPRSSSWNIEKHKT